MRAGLGILTTLLLWAGAAAAQVHVLDHVTLIDGTGAAPRSDVAIVLEAGRIAAITVSTALQAPSGAVIDDLRGKFVVPGIINAHGHVGPVPRDPQLRQYAQYGVTTTTSMSFDLDDIADFKARQRAGELNGARVLTVKYRFMSAPFQPGSESKTPEEARAKVDEIVAKGTDFVKVWIDSQGGKRPKLARDIVAAVLDQGRRHGKTTMAHIVELDDARFVVDQGVNILAHNVRDQEIPDDFLATLKRRDVAVISTLAREEGMFVYGDAPAFIDDPFFQKGLTPERFQILKTRKREEQASDPERTALRAAFAMDKRNVARLAAAGVRLGFGTDSGGELNRFFIQGFFEHRQMELLVDSGLTPMQVIEAFSRTNSQLLGIDREFGTLAPGKAADLLVLARNPLDAITNMRTIDAVYLGGKVFK
jgi:imidazolonepropionase-like amidohydrolase